MQTIGPACMSSGPRACHRARVHVIGPGRCMCRWVVARPHSNFARNSPVITSNIEFTSLELQRFRAVSKNDRWKLRAKFVWRWPLQPVLALPTGRSPHCGRALRATGVLQTGAGGGFAALGAGCRRVAGVLEPRVVQFPPIGGGAAVHIQRRYSNAPPEAGRGVTTSNNQTFCSAPCMANIRPTMIELLSAWNSHE